MDDLNLFHILAPKIQDIGHGVRLCGQGDVASKTLVCFLDKKGAFHFGFGYKGGSNFPVVCWENNIRKNRTVPRGAFIIAFDEETTLKSRTHDFEANDFLFTAEWFDVNAQDNIRDELIALNNRQDKVADLIKRMAGLTIDQMDVVIQKIDELQGNK